jgi:hypothetical protein
VPVEGRMITKKKTVAEANAAKLEGMLNDTRERVDRDHGGLSKGKFTLRYKQRVLIQEHGRSTLSTGRRTQVYRKAEQERS